MGFWEKIWYKMLFVNSFKNYLMGIGGQMVKGTLYCHRNTMIYIVQSVSIAIDYTEHRWTSGYICSDLLFLSWLLS